MAINLSFSDWLSLGAIVFTALTYWKTFYPTYSDERTHLLITYAMADRMGSEAIAILERYAYKHNALSENFHESTVGDTLASIKRLHRDWFSDEKKETLRSTKMPKLSLEAFIKDYEELYREFELVGGKVEEHLDLALEKLNQLRILSSSK